MAPEKDGGSYTLPLLPITSAATLASIKDLFVNQRDVFIASFPKSGTTWMQAILLQLVAAAAGSTPGENLVSHISDFAPFLEADRSWDQSNPGCLADPAAATHARLGWRAYNTHLLPNMLPEGRECRIVYCVRDAKDVATSEWHHFSHMAPEHGGFEGSLDAFVREWLAGSLAFGAWAPHVDTWLTAARTDSRILVVRYEDLLADPATMVARVAQHIGADVPAARMKEQVLPRVSFAWMKEHESMFVPRSVRWVDKGDGFTFIRRGKSGDAHQLLDDDHRAAIDTATGEVARKWGIELEAP